MAIHCHSSLDANLVVAFGARGRGKKNVHELFTRNENEKKVEESGRKMGRKNRAANCSRYFELIMLLSMIISYNHCPLGLEGEKKNPSHYGIKHCLANCKQRIVCDRKCCVQL